MKGLILVLTLAVSFTTLLKQITVGVEIENGLTSLLVPKGQLELTTGVIKETSRPESVLIR